MRRLLQSASMDLIEACFELIKKTATELPSDVRGMIESAQKFEEGNAFRILSDVLLNADLAVKKSVPICQDTGSINFFVKRGQYASDGLTESILSAVDEATEQGLLRKNSVDPVTGKNIGNVPNIHISDGDFEIGLLLKGGGSENFSAQYSLPDMSLLAGRDIVGVEKCVLDSIFRAQGKACPPFVVGVCIGGQRDSGYLRAKEQLFRKAGERRLPELESSLLSKINSLGIGPMGLGGKTTALEVFCDSLPRHPASYFVSVSLNCWALRRYTMTLDENGRPCYT